MFVNYVLDESDDRDLTEIRSLCRDHLNRLTWLDSTADSQPLTNSVAFIDWITTTAIGPQNLHFSKAVEIYLDIRITLTNGTTIRFILTFYILIFKQMIAKMAKIELKRLLLASHTVFD